MARVIKAWLLNQKQEHLENKNGTKPAKETAADQTHDKGMKEKDAKAAAGAKKQPAPPAPAGKPNGNKPAEATPPPNTNRPPSGDSRRKNKLRERSGAKERIIPVGNLELI
jgi:hypothetical protein